MRRWSDIRERASRVFAAPGMCGPPSCAAAAIEALMAAFEVVQTHTREPATWLRYAAQARPESHREAWPANLWNDGVILESSHSARAEFDARVSAGMNRVLMVVRSRVLADGAIAQDDEKSAAFLLAFLEKCVAAPAYGLAGRRHEVFLYMLIAVWSASASIPEDTLHAAWIREVRRISREPGTWLGGPGFHCPEEIEKQVYSLWLAPLRIAFDDFVSDIERRAGS